MEDAFYQIVPPATADGVPKYYKLVRTATQSPNYGAAVTHGYTTYAAYDQICQPTELAAQQSTNCNSGTCLYEVYADYYEGSIYLSGEGDADKEAAITTLLGVRTSKSSNMYAYTDTIDAGYNTPTRCSDGADAPQVTVTATILLCFLASHVTPNRA
jgi:hypothetical protein